MTQLPQRMSEDMQVHNPRSTPGKSPDLLGREDIRT